MQAAVGPAPASGKAETYRYVTLISNNNVISGCKEEPVDPAVDPAPAAPESSPAHRPPHMSSFLDTKNEEKLTIAAVRERCTAMFSSVETTYALAVGVCAYDHVYVKEIRKFPQLSTHELYRVPLGDSRSCFSTTTSVISLVLATVLSTARLLLLDTVTIATDLSPSFPTSSTTMLVPSEVPSLSRPTHCS